MMFFHPYGVKQYFTEKKINFLTLYPRLCKVLDTIWLAICIVLLVLIVFGMVYLIAMSSLSDPSGNGG